MSRPRSKFVVEMSPEGEKYTEVQMEVDGKGPILKCAESSS